MKLIHYTDKEFELKIDMEYSEDGKDWSAKPHGFWISVKGEYDWKYWCEAENFHIENLVVSYEVQLKQDANILYLTKEEEVLNFSKRYPYIKPQWDTPEGKRICGSYEIDWKKVKQEYQGIVIAPYQWHDRLHQASCWYYGWDCASGCIWDLDCIEEFKLIEEK